MSQDARHENATSILGYPIGAMGQGLPDPNNPELQVQVFYAAFGVMGYFPISQILNPVYYDWGFHGIGVRDGGLMEVEASSGTVTYDTGGVAISTAGANSGEASVSVKGWVDGGENSLFDRMAYAVVAASWSGVSSDSSLGDGEWCIGQFKAKSGILTNASTTEGWWVYSKCVAGTVTEYFCTSDGVSVTATDITGVSGPNYAEDRVLVVTFTQGEGGPEAISLKRGISSNILATHTTNLPSGACDSTDNPRFTATVKNGASDTQTRKITFRDVKLLAQ